MNISDTFKVSQWKVPIQQPNIQIDQTNFPQLPINTNEKLKVEQDQKTKKLQSTSKTRRKGSYASLFKNDTKSHGDHNEKTGEVTAIDTRKMTRKASSTAQSQNLQETNQKNVMQTELIAPAVFYKNVPPPHLAMQQPMYAAVPIVTPAAEVTTPCGEKLYIPLDRNKYELKSNDVSMDEQPQLLGAHVFQKESEMDGYEHSPRPVMYRGSRSDEEVSDVDSTSKSSSYTSVDTSDSRGSYSADEIRNGSIFNTDEPVNKQITLSKSEPISNKINSVEHAREAYSNIKTPDKHSYDKQKRVRQNRPDNSLNADLQISNSNSEENHIDIVEMIKTMANKHPTDAFNIEELSKNGNASGDSGTNETTQTMNVQKQSYESNSPSETTNSIGEPSVLTDQQTQPSAPDMSQCIVYTQQPDVQQQQMQYYTQVDGEGNNIVYYQNWQYAPQTDNPAPLVYSQYQPADMQYGVAPYIQYGYTEYSAYPEMVCYNGADYMNGYSNVAWSVPQMESPLQEAYHFNGEVWDQQEYAQPENECTFVNEPQDTVATETVGVNTPTVSEANTGPSENPEDFTDFPAEIPPENHADNPSDMPPGIHTGIPAHIITDASVPKDPPLYPALHVSDDGLVTVILRHGVFLEMTADRDLRLVCHDRKLVAAMDKDGTCACLIHPAVKVHQIATTVDVELYLSRKVKVMTENTMFGNNFDNYVFDYNMIERKTDLPNYLDQSDDKSVGFLNTDTGFFNLDIALRTSEIVRKAYFEVYQTNGSKVIVNGVKIVQTDNGDVTVYSGPIKYLRLSPIKNIIRLRSQFLDADIETNWNVKLRRGVHSLNASYLGLTLTNGNIKASLDQNNKMQAFELPDHKPLSLGKRRQEKRPGVPNFKYIDVAERRQEPEGDHSGYPKQHGI